MLVRDLLNRKEHKLVFFLRSTDTVLVALKLMEQQNIGAIVVDDGNKNLLGIVTERDICRKVFPRRLHPEDVLLLEVMTEEGLITVTPEDDLEKAMVLMDHNHIRHLIVLEKDKVIGVISIRDVNSAILAERDQMLGMLERYIHGS